MAREDNWRNEPRDERGRWTTGGEGFAALGEGVDAALSGLPMVMHDRLDAAVNRFEQRFRSDVAAALPAGKADGAGVLVDTLNQVSVNGAGDFGRARRDVIAELRAVAIGLRSGQSIARSVAVTRLREILNRAGMMDEPAHAMLEVEQVKLANVKGMARVLENEAGSRVDQPIMEAVGHTVLNRMRRNETAAVMDVSGQYTHGKTTPSPDTRRLAIMLLNGRLPDNTVGATHFYQPYAMAHPTPVPKGDRGQDLSSNPPKNYEYVPGVTVKDRNGDDAPAFSVRPLWADGMQQLPVKDIPDSLARFFLAPGSRHVR